MSERHILKIDGVTQTAAGAFDVYIPAPSGYRIELVEVDLQQSTEEGDAQSEQVALWIQSGVTVGGSGSSVNSTPINTRGAAVACTINTTNSSTSGSVLQPTAFNVQAGWCKEWPLSEHRHRSAASGNLCLKVEGPTDAITWYGSVTFEIVA